MIFLSKTKGLIFEFREKEMNKRKKTMRSVQQNSQVLYVFNLLDNADSERRFILESGRLNFNANSV